MTPLSFTLLSDGSSDRALLPILTWVLRQQLAMRPINPPQWADLRRLPHPPESLVERICRTLYLYPCDLLFIHRDAESQDSNKRYTEISEAILKSGIAELEGKWVAVVPVRMQEAWLLFDEAAIRRAASNPNGRVSLRLPSLAHTEAEPGPKQMLHDALLDASELAGRKRRSFNPNKAAHDVAQNIIDTTGFASLRALSAFRRLEADVASAVRHLP